MKYDVLYYPVHPDLVRLYPAIQVFPDVEADNEEEAVTRAIEGFVEMGGDRYDWNFTTAVPAGLLPVNGGQ